MQIQPTGGSPFQPPAQVEQMQGTAQKLLTHLTAHAGSSQSQYDVEQLQAQMQELQTLNLSSNMSNLVNVATSQLQTMSESPTPSTVALFQGTCTTLSESLSTPQVNVPALLAQNQLSSLAHALHAQMHDAHQASDSPACEALLETMQVPLSTLQQLASSSQLASDPAELATALTEYYEDHFGDPKTTTLGSVSQFSEILDSLNIQLLNP